VVAQLELRALGSPELGHEWAAVVGHDRERGDAVGGEVGPGSLQEPDCGEGLFVVEDLDVGEAGGVVDGDVDELPAHTPVAVVSFASAGDAVARNVEATELFDVDVDQLTRVAPAVTVGGLGWLESPQPVQSQSLQDRAHR